MMDGAESQPLPVMLDTCALGRLMPMHLWLDADGRIRSAGPTLHKLCAGRRLCEAPFGSVFALRRPKGIRSCEDLAAHPAGRLQISLVAPPHTGFKGHAVQLDPGQGTLLNLSFGIDVARAVRDHRLTDSDFAATDLAVELLYLMEAKSAVLDELRRLNTRLQSAKQSAEELALTDTLTGLSNRRAMDQALGDLVRSGSDFGLMHLDLDHFKQVNDTLGHAAGDHVLCAVAGALRSVIRAGDILARVGGDEFVILFPEVRDYAPLERVAARLLKRLNRPIRFEGNLCRVSASAGATLSVRYNPPRPDRMLSDADHALYASKRDGGGQLRTLPHDRRDEHTQDEHPDKEHPGPPALAVLPASTVPARD